MIVAVADTHAVIWYLSGDKKLSNRARSYFENAILSGDQIIVSSISLVEMVYLVERQKITPQQFTDLANELRDPDSIFVEVTVDLAIARTLSRVDAVQIPDMPDRIIAATALHLNVPIISRDARIQLSTLTTIW